MKVFHDHYETDPYSVNKKKKETLIQSQISDISLDVFTKLIAEQSPSDWI